MTSKLMTPVRWVVDMLTLILATVVVLVVATGWWFRDSARELRIAWREDWPVHRVSWHVWASLMVAVAVATLAVLIVTDWLGVWPGAT